jgi:hypothetical protein
MTLQAIVICAPKWVREHSSPLGTGSGSFIANFNQRPW